MSFKVQNAPRKRGRAINRPEQALQISVVRYLDLALPDSVQWFHPPNGGGRTPYEGVVFKSLGVKPGIPDLCFVWNGHAYGVELKSESGTLTIAQIARQAALRTAGMPVETCRSIEEVRDRLQAWGFPLRGIKIGRAA
jgi:hypothetical protein